jgi:hypothetical protein
MPLDDLGFIFNPAAYVAVNTDPYRDRWTPAGKGTVARPRAIEPRSDAQALLHIWQMLETRWSRKYNDGNNHCIVGWVGETCCPSTINDNTAPQVVRLMQRLHDALPKSAQRKGIEHRFTLAKYNDTHSLPTVRAWVHRAYLAEVNARIEALNRHAA